MKKIILFVLAASLPLSAATVQVNSSIRDKTAASLGIPADGVAPQAVRAYKTDRAALQQRAAAVFERNPVAAAKTKGRAPEASENEYGVTYRSGPIEYEVSNAAGAEILVDLDRYTRREEASQTVDEKAIEDYARKYIAENMSDVDQGEASFAGVKKIMDSIASMSKDGKVADVSSGVANYIAVFQRRINKVPVVGPGEKIRVYFAANGDVVGHSRIWREIEKTPAGPARAVVSPGRVQEALAKTLAQHPAQSVEIDFLEFGYMGQGRYTRQETLNPVYLIGYKAGEESKRVIKVYDAYTGAELAPPADPPGDAKRAPKTTIRR